MKPMKQETAVLRDCEEMLASWKELDGTCASAFRYADKTWGEAPSQPSFVGLSDTNAQASHLEHRHLTSIDGARQRKQPL